MMVKPRPLMILFCLLFGLAAYGRGEGVKTDDLPLEKLNLPGGFRIELYSGGVANARSLALGSEGTLFVGTRRKGSVYAVIDRNGDHKADRVVTLAQGLYMPNGVAFRDGDLYVAEVNRILRYNQIEDHLDSLPQPVVFLEGLPRERHHGWKFIRFGPDDRLYVPIGAPCNVCDPDDRRYATISRVDLSGGNFEVFAEGVRNTVGFDWHPKTRELWFTDNGRDWLGDDLPPDELNRAPRQGMHFGFPYCHGSGIPDPEFGRGKDCSDYTGPEVELHPHTAAIGMRFYTGTMFPERYRDQILIAEHGSWNRKSPIGYRLTLVRIENGVAQPYEVFVDGWLQGKEAWGRPADLLVMPDGSVLVSDDKAGAVVRISYR